MGLKPNGNAAASANIEAARLQHDAAIDVANIQSNNAQAAARINSDAALEAARIGSSTALQAAGISAAGSVHAAGIAASGARASAATIASASRYSADRIYQTADEAAERQEAAAVLSIDELNQARDASLDVQSEQFNLANERLQPFVEMGAPALDYLSNAATLDGFLGNLASISSSSAYRDLYDERMSNVSNYAAQRGMGRSGAALQAAADMSTTTQLGLDGIVYARNIDNANIGQNAVNSANATGGAYANNVTGIETGTSANISNVRTGTATNQGSLLTNAAVNAGQIQSQGAIAQGRILANGANTAAGYVSEGANASAQGVANAGNYQAQGLVNSSNALANGLTQSAYFQGAGIMGAANATSNGMVNAANAQLAQDQQNWDTHVAISNTVASFFISDERLKVNMEAIGKVGDLTLYEWDWTDEAKGIIGTEMGTGYKAQEVQEKYPDCVQQVGDVLMINYPQVNDILRERLAA